jgi:hypothetical protein
LIALCSFNAQPEAPAVTKTTTNGVAGACGWALNDYIDNGS